MNDRQIHNLDYWLYIIHVSLSCQFLRHYPVIRIEMATPNHAERIGKTQSDQGMVSYNNGHWSETVDKIVLDGDGMS